MNVFDLRSMKAQPYEHRDRNVFYQVADFKSRIIELPPVGGMPTCEMSDHVIFYFVSGEARITIDGQTSSLSEGQCLINPPGTFSMTSKDGAKLMGIQIFAHA